MIGIPQSRDGQISLIDLMVNVGGGADGGLRRRGGGGIDGGGCGGGLHWGCSSSFEIRVETVALVRNPRTFPF